jgi:hypothetical protein
MRTCSEARRSCYCGHEPNNKDTSPVSGRIILFFIVAKYHLSFYCFSPGIHQDQGFKDVLPICPWQVIPGLILSFLTLPYFMVRILLEDMLIMNLKILDNFIHTHSIASFTTIIQDYRILYPLLIL